MATISEYQEQVLLSIIFEVTPLSLIPYCPA